MPEHTTISAGLYLVATPIGNLAELTERALGVLKSVELVLCEDTRHSRKLFSHYGLSKPLLSYHRFNERAQQQKILDRLSGGAAIALVSDAGSPTVSDPGTRLVAACHVHGIAVIPIGGSSAVISAVMASGMAENGFIFSGFAPSRPGTRRKWLEEKLHPGMPLVVFETPHRLLDLLKDIRTIVGELHPLCLARELSKRFEQIRVAPAGELLAWCEENPQYMRGECTLVIDAMPDATTKKESFSTNLTTMAKLFIDCGVPVSVASNALARVSGLPKRHCYQTCLTYMNQ